MSETSERSERIDAFKRVILHAMQTAGRGVDVPKSELVRAAKNSVPQLCDDSEPCYEKCKGSHPRWKHLFDRAVYDLTQTRPRKLVRTPGKSIRKGAQWH